MRSLPSLLVTIGAAFCVETKVPIGCFIPRLNHPGPGCFTCFLEPIPDWAGADFLFNLQPMVIVFQRACRTFHEKAPSKFKFSPFNSISTAAMALGSFLALRELEMRIDSPFARRRSSSLSHTVHHWTNSFLRAIQKHTRRRMRRALCSRRFSGEPGILAAVSA